MEAIQDKIVQIRQLRKFPHQTLNKPRKPLTA